MKRATAADSAETRGRAAGAVLFAALVGLLAARPLLGESFTAAEFSFLSPEAMEIGTSRGVTALVDSLLLLLSGLTLLVRAPRTAWARVMPVGLALLTAAVVISTLAAGDQRAAMNAGLNLVATAIGAACLARVAVRPWMVRAMVAAVMASCAANAVKCINQRTYELQATLEAWQQRKAELLAQGAVRPDDPLIENYERRIRAAEASGYHFHPNVTGSMLAMGALAAAGVLAASVQRRAGRDAALAAGLAGLSAAGVWLTGSMGAAVAGIAGLVVMAAAAWRADWPARHARRVVIAAGAAYLLLIVGVGAFGALKGTLPGSSLAFRWYYWSAAGRAWLDAPWTGVGRENFGDAFAEYKSAASVEEARDPHNLWVSLLVELGPLGLVAGALLAGGSLTAAVRGLRGDAGGPAFAAREAGLRAGVLTGAVVTLGVAAVASGLPLTNVAVAFLWAVELAGVWLLAYWAALSVTAGCASGRGRVWIAAGIAGALVAGLLHALLDFTLLTPAGLAVFGLLAAAGAALGRDTVKELGAGDATNGRRAAVCGVAMLLLAVIGLMGATVPTMSAQAVLTELRARLAGARGPADVTAAMAVGELAVAADSLDPDTPRSAARALLQLADAAPEGDTQRSAWLRTAERWARTGRDRNAASAGGERLLAQVHLALYRAALAEGKPKDAALNLVGAAASYEAAVMRSPTNPRLLLEAARAWGLLASEGSFAAEVRTEAREKALRLIERALGVDAARPAGDVVRLSAEELANAWALAEKLRE